MLDGVIFDLRSVYIRIYINIIGVSNLFSCSFARFLILLLVFLFFCSFSYSFARFLKDGEMVSAFQV
jgi:hypothetical protein